jgi:hypothetical protein
MVAHEDLNNWLEDVALHLTALHGQYHQGIPNSTMAPQIAKNAEQGKTFVIAIVPLGWSESSEQRLDQELLKGILENGLQCGDGDYMIATIAESQKIAELKRASGENAVGIAFGCEGSEDFGSPSLAAPSLASLRLDIQLKRQFWGELKEFMSAAFMNSGK